MVIHGLTVHALVEIDECSIELRTIHTGKLGLAANLHTARAAHARTVHHQRVETHHTRDS